MKHLMCIIHGLLQYCENLREPCSKLCLKYFLTHLLILIRGFQARIGSTLGRIRKKSVPKLVSSTVYPAGAGYFSSHVGGGGGGGFGPTLTILKNTGLNVKS